MISPQTLPRLRRMKSFATTTTIDAPASTIWRLLTTADAYPTWNTTVDRIDGRIALGETITVHAKINPGRAFPVKVRELTPERSMRWASGMPLGLFRGERVYTLTPAAGGGVEFSMRESFSGLLAPLIGRSIPDLQPAFDAFAADLKRAAETEGGS